MYDIEGERVSGGSPSWYDVQTPAKTHSAVVERLLAAGATITNKTICDEFFYSIAGVNFHYGTPLNPKAPARIPGGSSSGSASACAAGSCDIAIGSDTAGSIRVPASLCGVYGIRTTVGRMDLRGAMKMAPSFDAGGWLAPTAELVGKPGPALLSGWLENPKAPQRLSVLSDLFEIAAPSVSALCRAYLKQAALLLPPANEVVLAGERVDIWREALRLTQAHEVWRSFGDFIVRHGPRFGPGVGERMRIAASVTEDLVAVNRPILLEVNETLERLTSSGGILALPTSPSPAPLLNASESALEDFRVRTMRLVCAASISGLPQITIPIGSIDNAPVGLSFIAWRNGDEALLDLAARLAAQMPV